MSMRVLSLFLLHVGTARGCGGCVVGVATSKIGTTATAGQYYVEFDLIGAGSCRPAESKSAIADFAAGTLTPTESTRDVPAFSFGAAPDYHATKTFDTEQPATGTGGVKIAGVTYILPGLQSQWSSYRTYIWSWWYSTSEAQMSYSRLYLPCPEVASELHV